MDRTGFTLEDVRGRLVFREVDGGPVELDENFVDATFHEGGVGGVSGAEFGSVDAASFATY